MDFQPDNDPEAVASHLRRFFDNRNPRSRTWQSHWFQASADRWPAQLIHQAVSVW